MTDTTNVGDPHSEQRPQSCSVKNVTTHFPSTQVGPLLEHS